MTKKPTTATTMSEEEYIRTRVEDQMKWYGKKGSENKNKLHQVEILVILFSAAIPILAGYTSYKGFNISLVIAILGALIAILSGMNSLMKYKDLWVEYRATAEQLKRELHFYKTKCTPYDGENAFKIFVVHIENILGEEINNWTSYQNDSD